MYKLVISAATGLAIAVGAQAQTSQQPMEAACNKKAGDKKGEVREAFIKACMDQSAQRNMTRPQLTRSPAVRPLPPDSRRDIPRSTASVD